MAAWRWLAKAYQRLGADGSALVHAALVQNMTARQIASARGLGGQGWENYFAKRAVGVPRYACARLRAGQRQVPIEDGPGTVPRDNSRARQFPITYRCCHQQHLRREPLTLSPQPSV
jgi:hypothetical protein